MLTVLHGDNLIASYNLLQKYKKDFSGEIVTLESKSTTPKELEEVLGQSALFDTSKLVILEGNPKANLVEAINALAASFDLIVWADKKITTTPFKGKILELKDTTNTNFKFADSFTSRDLKNSLHDLQTLLDEKTPSELIVGILTRQLKLIMQVLDGEVSNINPYVVSKIKIHLKKWTPEKVKKGLKELLVIDHHLKTGRIDPQSALFNYLTKTLV